MTNNLLELFLEKECDEHARSALLEAIDKRPAGLDRKGFTFNRFNVLLDFVNQQVVIDDELNPADGECCVPLEEFLRRLQAIE